MGCVVRQTFVSFSFSLLNRQLANGFLGHVIIDACPIPQEDETALPPWLHIKAFCDDHAGKAAQKGSDQHRNYFPEDLIVAGGDGDLHTRVLRRALTVKFAWGLSSAKWHWW